MKKVCSFFTALVLSLILIELRGEVKNGYASGVEQAKISLSALEKINDSPASMTMMESQRLRQRINLLKSYIRLFDVTQKYLIELRITAPGLIARVDSLTDKNGEVVDVYVLIVAERSLPAGVIGVTNLELTGVDEHSHSSEFGANSVSVRISEDVNCLKILAHELGHVYYQIPNLSEYRTYFSNQYVGVKRSSSSIGHDAGDPSGRQAREFEKELAECQAVARKSNRISQKSERLKPTVPTAHQTL
jgi:hypothetical protein